jgi:hypothetical protein
MKDEVLSIKEMLLKKALGFTAQDVIDEYVFKEGEFFLIKRKKVRKKFPPDVKAAKAYIELTKNETVTSMTDEQLEEEKINLMNMLKKLEDKTTPESQGEGGI